jgi:hypothetical protein
MATAPQANLNEHLRRIVDSPGFVNAPRMQRFLSFIVEAAQSGETEALKESVLGREVFDRGADFDPRTDPIVRVEARRLRSRLEEYYSGPGAAEALRIEIPKGGYIPVFTAASQQRAANPSLKFAAAGILLACAGAALWWALAPQSAAGQLAVVPAHWIWARGEALVPERELELAESITAGLVRDTSMRVLGWPVVSQRRGAPLAQFGDHVLLVAVRPGAGGERLTCYLLDAQTGRKTWVWDEPLSPGDESRIAAAIRERMGRVMRK